MFKTHLNPKILIFKKKKLIDIVQFTNFNVTRKTDQIYYPVCKLNQIYEKNCVLIRVVRLHYYNLKSSGFYSCILSIKYRKEFLEQKNLKCKYASSFPTRIVKK